MLIVSIILPTVFFSQPPKAQAVYPVTDALNLVRNIYTGTMTALTKASVFISAHKETVLDPLAYAAARMVIHQLTQSIVQWINNGFEGSPSFIQDPGRFLTDTADQAIGEFIFGSDLAFLCDPFGDGQFKLNIQLALGLSYSTTRHKINCTLSDVLKNTKDAYKKFTNGDFIAGGGWDSWISVSANPQNNELGAMVIASAEMEAKIDANKAQASMEAGWGTGTLSMKQCRETVVNNQGVLVREVSKFDGNPATHSSTDLSTDDMALGYSTKVTCSTVTPGSLINQQMEEVVGSDLKQLQLADEFNEIVGALANFMISKVAKKDGGGLLGAGAQGDTADNKFDSQMAGLTDAYNSANQGLNLADTILAAQIASSTMSNSQKIVAEQIILEQKYQANLEMILTNLYYDPASAYNLFENIAIPTCNPEATVVLDLIDGTTPYDTTDPDRLGPLENLTVPALEAKSEVATQNLTALGTLFEEIKTKTSTEALFVIRANDLINTPSMHHQSDVDSFSRQATNNSKYTAIKNWLNDMKIKYEGGASGPRGTKTCRIDLSALWPIR